MVVRERQAESGASLKECTAWTRGIGKLWTAVGKASGEREATRDPFKRGKGFGFRAGKAQRHINQGPAVGQPVHGGGIGVLRATRVGEAKARVISI